jgi:DNA polymerase-3 subunit delta'
LQQNIVYAPLEASWRVVVIDPAESMNKNAANCLLKTLEEPPEATMLILVADTINRVLPTIISRCQKVVFNPLQEKDIQNLLEDEGIASEHARAVAVHAHGSLHRAHVLLDTTLFEDLEHLTASLTNHYTIEQRLELAGTLGKSADRLPGLLVLLLEWLRDVQLYRMGAHTQQLFNAARSESIQHAAEQITSCRLEMKIKQILKIMSARELNINMQLNLESLLLT